MMARLLLLVCASVLLALPAGAAAPLTVILVRHAERAAAPATDPGLTAAGTARAQALAGALQRAKVDAIFTTSFRRTRDTAAPLAAAQHLTPRAIAFGTTPAAHAQEVARAVLAQPAGSLVVVVGHADTVPAIVHALGGPGLPELCADDFSAMFTVLLAPDRPARVIRTQYGAPTHDPARPCAEPSMLR